MRIEREHMYFEPRCISGVGTFCWYGGVYQDNELLSHTEETVYIRDDSEHLYIYELCNHAIKDKEGIQAECTLKLIKKIDKHNDQSCYGKSRYKR